MDADVMRQPTDDDETGITVWEAEFLDTATAPADDVRVAIPGYDNGRADFGPVVWTRKRDAAGWLYPQQGGLALVTQADTGRWWVLEWTP